MDPPVLFGEVDPARRYLPIAALQAQLDAMSYAKLNVMHIHMTDDQSWPLIVPSIPELAQNGAFSAEHTYSLAQIDSLVEYARLRGIRTYSIQTTLVYRIDLNENHCFWIVFKKLIARQNIPNQ